MFSNFTNFFGAGTQPVDINKDTYDRNNPAQQNHIDTQIELFEQSYTELKKSDLIYATLILGSYTLCKSLTHAIYIIPSIIPEILFASAVATHVNHVHNHEQLKAFKTHLNNLLDLKRWCENGNDINVTTDPKYRKLIATIKSHIKPGDVKFSKNIDPKLVALEYAELVADMIPPELLVDAERVNQVKQPDHFAWSSIFHVARTQATRILYNNRSSNETWQDWAAHQFTSIKSKFI